MLIRRASEIIPSSEITPEGVYINRRSFMGAAVAGAAAALSPGCLLGQEQEQDQQLKPNTFEEITEYNNFWEYGSEKSDPAQNAPGLLKPRPWTVSVEGLCNKPGKYQLEDFLKPHKIEDRIYRMRCVEAWSVVVPWRGFPLRDLIARAEPTPAAKYVEFLTLLDPVQMPLQKTDLLEWPYNEGLRLDEAMHPLTLMTTGLYGRDLPAQNGAPLRLIVPWKYGFKGIKSIVRIRFQESQPNSTWMKQNRREYGFYSNVNPNVDHPRWSQKRERRLPSLFKNTETLMFNGYANEVQSMYSGMDLKKFY
ncbi:MAG: protein-methionine-sulfoxide reductase catalytic subunit MsrP [Gemmatimonadota bacterium]